ncbi:hypothetical protein H2201_001200 [Coniosporium apollinis]|uniref:3'-phosphate/5'-hydroxy nucleic acid ligase n=1 Tax=Coniosporium apollinis TaxID=61459 RepID=A0ABQ9P6R1_9PEZI|nr:hypothetical protein H2201_001200 [Coniosporium apollinis]
MPIRITISNNAKQSQKAVLILPLASLDPAAPDSYRALVLKGAQNKLQIKKASRIFVGGTGQELCTEDEWKSVLRDDVTLLVSKGEEYVGLRKEVAQGGSDDGIPNPDCTINILAHAASVDSLSVTQVETTARTLPGLIHAVGQPDLHPGTKFPIGAVFVSKGWIHPPLIGGDIGCGMAWYKTKLNRSQVDGDKGRKVAEKLRGLEGAWRTQQEREVWLTDGEEECSAGPEWDSALGTIGAGNHFAEIQVVEDAAAEAGMGLCQNDVVLLVHSGSRGYGGNVLKRYVSDTNPSLREDAVEAKAYMKEHDRACNWAKANRDLIALRFLSCLEPGEEAWELGRNTNEQNSTEFNEAVDRAKAKLRERKVVDIWHNNVERIRWPPRPPQAADSPGELADRAESLSLDDDAAYAYIHRKGAAPTYNPQMNKPLTILPLPGSRGKPTIMLRPTFSQATQYGYKNALSLAHGAGRAMSRTKALTSINQKYAGDSVSLLQPNAASQAHVKDGKNVRGGTWVICDEKDLVWEEAPEAYKDVYAVAEDLVREGVAEVIGWCRPRVSYKVRNEGR